MQKTTEELEKQNLMWIEKHPKSVLATLFKVWEKTHGADFVTCCMLTVAAYLELDDYETFGWKEYSRNEGFDSLFRGDLKFLVVEFHQSASDREEGADPDHTLLYWYDSSAVWEIESWFVKKRPLMRLVCRPDAESKCEELKATSKKLDFYLSP